MKKVIFGLLIAVLVLVGMMVPFVPEVMAGDEEYVVTVFLPEDWSDQGWGTAHKNGFDELKSLGNVIDEWDLGYVIELDNPYYDTLRVNFITHCGYGGQIESMMRSAIAAQQPDMTFAAWFDSYQAVEMLALEFPDVIFNHCSSYPLMKSSDFSTENVGTYFIKNCLADYVVGVVAGTAGYDKVGFVATHPIPEPIRAVNAFTLGLQAGFGDVVEVNVLWINSWLDRELEYQAAQTLIDAGYDIIRQLPDTPTTSMVACENGGVALGYGLSTLPFAPCTLVTNEWRWGKYYTACVLDGLNGDWEPHDWFEAGSNLVFNPDTPQELIDAAAKVDTDDTWAGPISGFGWDVDGNEYRVFVPEGETLTDMDILTMSWFVDGVVTAAQPPTPVDSMSRFIVE